MEHLLAVYFVHYFMKKEEDKYIINIYDFQYHNYISGNVLDENFSIDCDWNISVFEEIRLRPPYKKYI